MVAVCEDVSGMSLRSMPKNHRARLQLVGKRIRAKLIRMLAATGLSGAMRFKMARRQADADDGSQLGDEWQLVSDVMWKQGEQLAPPMATLPDLAALQRAELAGGAATPANEALAPENGIRPASLPPTETLPIFPPAAGAQPPGSARHSSSALRWVLLGSTAAIAALALVRLARNRAWR